MSHYVYAIKSDADSRVYVGMSQNVKRRVKEHNLGQVTSTKHWRPWQLIYKEDCGNDRKRARRREKYFKSGVGKEFLKNIVLE